MNKKEILIDVINKLDRQTILDKSYENDEKPYGYIIDVLKDDYGLPKTSSDNVVKSILAFFEIDNSKY